LRKVELQMNKYLLAFLLLPAILILNSCCKGGSGGKATLNCSVFHHTKPIVGATVYIKYNATEFPGTDPSSYSDHQTASGASNTITFTGLNCGDYFLYGVGYDSSLMVPVTGGIHFQIKYSDRKHTETTNVPVTE
jgi:hypothetical protein